MKKKLLLLILCALCFIGCGKIEENPKQNDEKSSIDKTVETEECVLPSDIIKEPEESVEEKQNTIENKEEIVSAKEIEIILAMMDFSEDADIETYVEELNKENEKEYFVYNEYSYYYKISEEERIALLSEVTSEITMKDFLDSINETYPGVFKRISFENEYKKAILYVDGLLYNDSGLVINLYSYLTSCVYLDTLQAYNLVPIDERHYIVEVIDEKTNTTLYISE